MNPIFLEIGSIRIYWYSIFILLGFTIGYFLALKEAKKFNISKELITNLVFYIVIFALLGARIYYVLFNLDYYLKYPIDIFKVWEGGLAIHGGIILGCIVLIKYAKKNNLNIRVLFDIGVTSLIIGQAIGRWGNFMNSEAYGPITTLEYLKSLRIPNFVINGMYIDSFYRHPTFLYESIWCFIGFIILIIVRRIQNYKIGYSTCFYLIWYGIERFFVEGLRTDSLMLFNLKIAQIISLIMIIIGVVYFILINKKKELQEKYNEG